jgi:O-antigen ligase
VLFSASEISFSILKLKNIKIKKRDFFVLLFLFVNIISTLLSDNSSYALVGAKGRDMGLITVALLCVLYFVISYDFTLDDKFYYVLSLGSMLVSVIGMLNFMSIDLLGFYNGLTNGQKSYYISTLGHTDIYTSYFSLTVPILYMVYLETKKRKLRFISGISLIINICGLVSGQCDSGYIILLTSFILVVVLTKGKQRLSVYLLPMVISTIGITLMFKINEKQPEQREISRFATYVYNNKMCVLLVLIFIICFIIEKMDKTNKLNIKIIWKPLIVASVLAAISYIVAMIIFSTALKNVNLGSMESVLRFSDSFGSYRGYIWKVLIKDYSHMNICNKLFGIGTDTMLPYLMKKYGYSMYVVTNAYYDNAHNELLQYLITIGAVGLMAYIGVIFNSIKNGIKSGKIVILAAVICYLVQSLVNINQVVTTPLFFILLGML